MRKIEGAIRLAVVILGWIPLLVSVPLPLWAQEDGAVAFTPSSVDFGEVPLLTSSDNSVGIRNSGSTTISLTEIAVVGDPAFLLVAGGAPGTLRPGDERLTTVRCLPLSTRPRPAQAELRLKAGATATWSAPLTCQGVGPEVFLSETALQFGFVSVGDFSVEGFRVANSGNRDLTLYGVDLSPEGFYLEDVELPDVLAPDRFVDVVIRFEPGSSGALEGSVTIRTDAPGSPHVVELSGAGISPSDPKLFVSDAALDFGVVEVGSQRSIPLLLRNDGGGALSVEAMLGANAAAEGFGFAGESGFPPLQAGDSVVIGIRFAPPRVGVRSSELGITHDAYNVPSPLRIPLTGSGRHPALATPTLVSPADGAQAVRLPVVLSWSPVEGASSYDIQLDEKGDFLAPVLVRTDVLGTTTIVTGLSPDREYHWRVRADGLPGPGPWSSARRFTTAPLPPGPVANLSPLDGEEGVAVPARLSWTPVERAATYEVHIAEDADFVTLVLDRAAISGTSVGDIVLEAARVYHWRVRAVNAGGAGPWRSASFRTYPGTIQLDARRTFGPPAPESYRMVSLPGAVDLALSTTLTGSASKDWNAYYDNGSASDYLVEHDGTDAFHFRPGRAFWLHAREPWGYQGASPTVPIDGQKRTSISLHPGWNQVGNPFERPVRWADVKAVNEMPDVLWRFEGTYFEGAVMEPYHGYYFFNRHGLSGLRIPYPGDPPSGVSLAGSASAVTSSEWLQIEAWSLEGHLARVEIGFSEEASDGIDEMDQFQPPGFFGGVHLGIHHDMAPPGTLLAREVRPTPSVGASYRLVIARTSPGPLVLRAGRPASWTDMVVALVDQEEGLVHRLEEQPVRLDPFEGRRELTLLVGSTAYVAAHEALLVPASPRLRPLYPNPSGGRVQVEFGLPETMDVWIDVFSVDGRRVADLAAGRFTGGWHRIEWSGSRGSGGMIAPGVYLVRLVHSEGSVSRSVVIRG